MADPTPECVEDLLRRRAAECRALLAACNDGSNATRERRGRLQGRASAYDHAADIVAAEIARRVGQVQEMVKSAYWEGHEDRRCKEMPDVHDDWLESKSCAALEKL